MKIEAMQKLTLLDYPGKVACTIFTHGCNFRCPFCHNSGLVTQNQQNEISTEEIFSFLKSRQGILEGVCITGGEPLMQNDIDGFLREIKSLGFSVKLDTNGSFPKKLRSLIDLGLVDYVAMDIKNSPKKYNVTIGKTAFDFSAVSESVELLKSGVVDYEFRTTVTRDLHTLEDLKDIARWLSGCDAHYLQQFVDSGALIDQNITGYSDEELKEMYRIIKRQLPATHLRGIS